VPMLGLGALIIRAAEVHNRHVWDPAFAGSHFYGRRSQGAGPRQGNGYYLWDPIRNPGSTGLGLIPQLERSL
jgi:hypothetical protein